MGLFNNVITSICFDPAGNMIVAGSFTRDASGNIQTSARSTNAGLPYFIAKWDGTSWSAVGDVGIIQNFGTVYAGGRFQRGPGEYYVAKCN